MSPSFMSLDAGGDLTAERSFDSQATRAINVLDFLLTCSPLVLVQPGTSRRSVDWCRHQMSALYIKMSFLSEVIITVVSQIRCLIQEEFLLYLYRKHSARIYSPY